MDLRAVIDQTHAALTKGDFKEARTRCTEAQSRADRAYNKTQYAHLPAITARMEQAVNRIINGGSPDKDLPAPPALGMPARPIAAPHKRAGAYYRVGFSAPSQFVGQTVTFHVQTHSADSEFAPGKTVLSYVIDESEGRFRGCAFVVAGRIQIWLRFLDHDSVVLQGCRLLEVDPLGAAVQYGRDEVKCGVCGRPLLTRESREAGIGPVCRAKIG